MIVQQVVAALRSSGATGDSPHFRNDNDAKKGTVPSRACCGDERGPGKLFLTAAMVRQRLDGGHGLELAANEFLTPAAQDVVQQMQVSVTRATASEVERQAHLNSAERQATSGPRGEKQAPPNNPSAFAVMVDRPNDKTAATLMSLSREGIRLLDFHPCDCPVEGLQALCRAIGEGKLAGGIAMLRYASDAMVLANKFRGVRAVQGTRPESVSAAVRHVAANLLVLEHEFSTFYELRAMARVFVTDRMLTGIASDVQAAITAAEGR